VFATRNGLRMWRGGWKVVRWENLSSGHSREQEMSEFVACSLAYLYHTMSSLPKGPTEVGVSAGCRGGDKRLSVGAGTAISEVRGTVSEACSGDIADTDEGAYSSSCDGGRLDVVDTISSMSSSFIRSSWNTLPIEIRVLMRADEKVESANCFSGVLVIEEEVEMSESRLFRGRPIREVSVLVSLEEKAI